MNFANKTSLLRKFWRHIGHLPLDMRAPKFARKGQTKRAPTRVSAMCWWSLYAPVPPRAHHKGQCAKGGCALHVRSFAFKGQLATAAMQVKPHTPTSAWRWARLHGGHPKVGSYKVEIRRWAADAGELALQTAHWLHPITCRFRIKSNAHTSAFTLFSYPALCGTRPYGPAVRMASCLFPSIRLMAIT